MLLTSDPNARLKDYIYLTVLTQSNNITKYFKFHAIIYKPKPMVFLKW